MLLQPFIVAGYRKTAESVGPVRSTLPEKSRDGFVDIDRSHEFVQVKALQIWQHLGNVLAQPEPRGSYSVA